MLAPEFPPVWGGVGTYIYELVKHLPKNVEIHVVTPNRGGFGGQKISSSGHKSLDCLGDNVHIHFISNAADSFFYNAQFQYACLKEVPKMIKDEGIDVIHSHTAQMPDLLLSIRKLKIPFVTTIHTTIKFQRMATKASHASLAEMEKSEKATYYLFPILRLAEEFYFKQSRFYITPSQWMVRWFKDNYLTKTDFKVIPNCVDIGDYKDNMNDLVMDTLIPKEAANKRIVLFVGRMLALKGVDVLVRAIPEILRKVGKDEILFIFAGPGDYDRFYRTLATQGVKSNFLFTGPLSKEAIIQIMKKSAVLVLPSYIENCPYTVLEAMACGTPVVASNVGGLPEIIKNNYDGILVNPGSSNALTDAVVNLLLDKSLSNLIGQRGKETIERKFSWQANLNKFVDAYFEAKMKFTEPKID